MNRLPKHGFQETYTVGNRLDDGEYLAEMYGPGRTRMEVLFAGLREGETRLTRIEGAIDLMTGTSSGEAVRIGRAAIDYLRAVRRDGVEGHKSLEELAKARELLEDV